MSVAIKTRERARQHAGVPNLPAPQTVRSAAARHIEGAGVVRQISQRDHPAR